MEISQTFGYRLGYSQQEWTLTQSVKLPDDTPREAVRAETILLGLKVRLEVLSSVYEQGEMEEEEMEGHISTGFRELLTKARNEMHKLAGKSGKMEKDADGDYAYKGYLDFLKDLVYIRDEVKGYLEEFAEEE